MTSIPNPVSEASPKNAAKKDANGSLTAHEGTLASRFAAYVA